MLFSDTLQNRILQDTSLVFGANIIARGMSFTFFLLVARWLSTEGYGIVRYTTSWAAVLCLMIAPFSLAWTRALAKETETNAVFVQTKAGGSAFILLMGTTLIVGGVWIWADRQLFLPAILVLLGLGVFYAYEGYLRGRFAFWELASYMILGNGLQLASLGILRWSMPSTISSSLVLGLYGIAFIWPIAVVTWFTRDDIIGKQRGNNQIDYDYQAALGTVLRSTLALAFVHNAHSLLLNLDIIFLGYFDSSKQVGYYAVAKSMLSMMLVLAQAAFAVLLPTSVRAEGQESRNITKVSGLLLILVLTVAGVMVLFAPSIVHILFSSRYAPAVPAMRLLIIGGCFYSVLIVLAAQGLGQRKDGAYTRIYVAVLGVNVVLNLILLPSLGLIGGAWAFLIASIVGSLMGLFEQGRLSCAMLLQS